MKKLFISFGFIIPVVSFAQQPKWELVNAFVQPKEELVKVYLDKNSIKTSDNDIRSFDMKMIYPNSKHNFQANFTVMCSRGYYLDDKYLGRPDSPKEWTHIFTRNTVMGDIKVTPGLAFHAVCADRLWKNKDVNTIEFQNKAAGSL
ncbi:MAG: hypothetical protein AB8V60_03595 [Coxiella endosymbiont of Dermacentor nuttalli]|jgi:hypothetical protein|uniref:hypothetical protein n=1 Tax=Acinetobacter sp. YH01006 TaxID=2601022 RepID=UPI0015D18B47|nr:hypothetical protein [Acinetobacter sp. YH01006]